MASLRTAADVAADYADVRAAWKRALRAEQAYTADAGVTRQLKRPDSDKLFEQMRELEAEYQALTGEGFELFEVVPVG